MNIFDVLTMVCGLALFLYGMQLMGDSLKRSAGSRLKTILGKMTSSPIRGFFLGLGITAIIQSSSATTVMVVGFVNSGTMTLAQSVGVIMGANVGAAVTFWITGLSGLGEAASGVADALQWLEPSSWMPVLALVGVILAMTSHRGKKRDVGLILMGFSILMVGMSTMSSSVAGLKESAAFQSILTVFNNPILGMLIGVAVTAVIQSSAASVGILQSLATTGAISYATAIPITMGQNIGTCITALLSSVSANRDGKRAAVIHLLFNVLGGVFFLAVFYVINAVCDFAFMETPINAFGIAAVHTVVKILTVLLFMPLNKLLVKLSHLIVKDAKDETATANLLDDRLFTSPSLAVERATEVTCDMARTSTEALILSMSLLDGYDAKEAEEVRKMEDLADRYEDELGSYLVRLSACSLLPQDSHQITKLLHLIGDFERISDHAVNIVESMEEMVDKKLEFSAEAQREIGIMRAATTEILQKATASFVNGDLEEAISVEPLEQVVDDLKDQIKLNHILRLQKSECTIEHGFILSDLLTNFERVSDHCSNIAGCMIEISEHDALDMHKYLAGVKKDTETFDKRYRAYKQQYSL